MSGTVLSTEIVFRPGQGRLHFAADATFGHHEVALRHHQRVSHRGAS